MGAGEGDAHWMEKFLARSGLGEMLPAARFEWLRALRRDQRYCGPACAGFQDAADACHGNAGDGSGQACGLGSGEEQFIVLAAVKGL